VTALPPLAAYHDLRWLFAFGQSWPAFVGVLVGMLFIRSAAAGAIAAGLVPAQGGDGGQVGQSGVPGAALSTLNDLIGKMSPYGPSGAQALIDSVSEVGAQYFWDISKDTGSVKPALRWLAVVPLADAVTMPTCPFPSGVVVVQAFHGGLLGDSQVRQMVEDFSAAAAAWRMPVLHPVCAK
jgi:hypothetical protein